MDIQVAQVDHAAMLTPMGDLALPSVTVLERTLEDLLTKEHVTIVIDLSNVAYVDSAIWGLLAQAAKRARQAQGELSLCAMGGQVLSAFKLIRLDQIIPVYPTRQEALGFERANDSTRRAVSPFARSART